MCLTSELWRSAVQKVMCLVLPAACFAVSAGAQTDTLSSLKEVIITGKKTPRISQGAAATQTLNAVSLDQMNVLQAADAVKHFAGVTVKDYGGIGGLKTISVRSLGANYTGIAYDGLVLSENQSGQIDLGRISLEGVGSLSLANADQDLNIRTARAMAYGSLLMIETVRPLFEEKKRLYGKAGLKAGSFGFFNPLLHLNAKLSEKVVMTLNTEWQKADGGYPFLLDYGGAASKEKRTNSDVNISRAEVNTFFQASDNSELRLKLYGYQSERGLPGATIFYNPYAPQRLWDKNLFAQSAYSSKLNDKYSLLFNARYNYNYIRYLDPGYLNSSGKQDDSYYQHEYYGSAAILAKLSDALRITASADAFANTLNTNTPSYARPSRYTFLTAVAARYAQSWFSVQASLLSSLFKETVHSGPERENDFRLSPTVILAFYPLAKADLQLRFFYKDIFRMPTFNDLYFSGTGNPALRPETAKQFDAGITYYKTGSKGHYISAAVDAYRNGVSDKIIAIPTKNLFVWTMMNVGKVQITGIDFTLRAGYQIDQNITLSGEGTYTYQESEDITDAGSKTYRNQIPYTPKHSGSASAGLKFSGFSINYNLLFSGSRYTLGQNIAENYLKGYTEQGVNISKRIHFKHIGLKLVAEALNITGLQYEVIRNFPMPGRSYRFTTLMEF